MVRAARIGWVIVVLGLSPAGAQPTAYPDRFEPRSVDEAQLEVIDRGLDWLARHQSDDGSWSPSKWTAECDLGQCGGGRFESGLEPFRCGVSSLALLAFLGRGHTPVRGDHQEVVAKGLRWLQGIQARDGSFHWDPEQDFGGQRHGPPPFALVALDPKKRAKPPPPPPVPVVDGGWSIYNSALGALALCDALALTGDEVLREPAERALDWCLRAQNPNRGWKYGIRTGRSDSSVSAWMAQVLRAARDAQLEVPDDAVKGVVNWFAYAAGASGKVGYVSPGGDPAELRQTRGDPEHFTNTAAGVFIRSILSKTKSRERRAMHGGVEQLAEAPPHGGAASVNYCLWYFGAHASVQVDAKGRRAFKPWLKGLEGAARRQHSSGCLRGAFPPDGVWCPVGGRVYATAAAILAYEAPDRLPKYKPKR